METVGVTADKQHIYQVLDNLSECQRHNGKIVAFQTEHRNTDQNTEQSCYGDSDQKRQQKSERFHCNHVSHAF